MLKVKIASLLIFLFLWVVLVTITRPPVGEQKKTRTKTPFLKPLPFLADFPYGFPSANRDIKSSVPRRLVEEVAYCKASKVFGEVNLLSVIPCSDFNGDVIVYQCVFSIGKTSSPSPSKIYERVKRAKGSNNPNKVWGVGEFCTVTVSARYDMYPVLGYQEGLPEFYVVLDKAAEIAKRRLDSPRVRVCRIYWLGPISQFFEFTGSGKKILVDIFTGKTYLPGQIQATAQKGAKSPWLKRLIKRQWQIFENSFAKEEK
jgi:hypothetical protein